VPHVWSDYYWPGVAIALIVAAYWGRVLRLVQKSYKKTGRAANFWPREPVGRALRFVWIPAVICWIAVPALVGFAVPLKWRSQLLWNNWIVASSATLIAFLALCATIVCWKKMGKSWRMGIDPTEKTQLIISGPYAYVRHPIYALSQLMMISSILAVPTIAMLIIGAIHLTFMQWEARREEQYLVATHGEEYANYLRRVGRFIPKSIGGYHGSAH
jgi:protein-S-isoprenylcysteine O-methyltransferase Ste14